MNIDLSRRGFLAATGAALVIPVALKGLGDPAFAATSDGQLGAYLRVEPDGSVTIMSPASEMGQGTHTGHAAIIADELGVDIAKIKVTVPLQPRPEFRLFFGAMITVGSFGVRAWVKPLRKAAAQARSVLIQAAAKRWGVTPASCTAVDGAVVHAASKRRLPFETLLTDAAGLPLPENPKLRPAETRRYVGKPIKRIDTPPKLNGEAIYGIDVRLPGMLYGAVRLSPVYGAEVASMNPKSIPDAIAVAPVPGGAVVIARSWWEAKQLADKLEISWKPTPHDKVSSDDLYKAMRTGLDATNALPVVRRGDAAAKLAKASNVIQADYEVPFLTHVSMEPITCTARVGGGRCEVWLSTQSQDMVRMTLERVTGLTAKDIFINTTFLGGGFGRKTHGEIAEQAAIASRAVGGRPVNVIWAREDDVQQGRYRPTMTARLRAELNDAGLMEAFHVRLSGPMMGREYRGMIRNNFDNFSHAVLGNHKYAMKDYLLDHQVVDVPPSLCPWRSVSSSQNGFFLEGFIDELAVAAKQDQLAFRRAHLVNQPAHLAVLDAAAKRAGWGRPMPGPNWGRGIAFVESYGSRCAQIADVEMVDNRPVVRRVVVALDCGEVINPGQIETQMSGSVIEGLGAALRCEITLKDGRAEQSNFDTYPILRMDEIPKIEVEIVNAGSPIGGVGEPGVPPLAPAVGNAIFAATGKRLRKMPFDKEST